MKLFFEQALEGIFFFELEEPVDWQSAPDKDKILEEVFFNMKIADANEAFVKQYGMKYEEVIGLTPADFFKHDLEHGKTVWSEFFDNGRLHTETKET